MVEGVDKYSLTCWLYNFCYGFECSQLRDDLILIRSFFEDGNSFLQPSCKEHNSLSPFTNTFFNILFENSIHHLNWNRATGENRSECSWLRNLSYSLNNMRLLLINNHYLLPFKEVLLYSHVIVMVCRKFHFFCASDKLFSNRHSFFSLEVSFLLLLLLAILINC
jgi:hypothetical protein